MSTRSFALTFSYYASTPGTHRYKEQAAEGEAIIGDLYVQKSAMGEEPVDSVRLTIDI